MIKDLKGDRSNHAGVVGDHGRCEFLHPAVLDLKEMDTSLGRIYFYIGIPIQDLQAVLYVVFGQAYNAQVCEYVTPATNNEPVDMTFAHASLSTVASWALRPPIRAAADATYPGTLPRGGLPYWP